MALIVQKYGGTSVGDADRIKRVAAAGRRPTQQGRATRWSWSSRRWAQSTDDLIDLAKQVSGGRHPREMDMLLTAGERISMALLAMAIRDQGVEAMSLTGSQAGILTDTSPRRRRRSATSGRSGSRRASTWAGW